MPRGRKKGNLVSFCCWIFSFLSKLAILLLLLGMVSGATGLASPSKTSATSSVRRMATTKSIEPIAAATSWNSTDRLLQVEDSDSSQSVASTTSSTASTRSSSSNSVLLSTLFASQNASKRMVKYNSNHNTNEPTLLEKLMRRCTVFWVAFRVFVDYKWNGRKANRLKRQLGLDERDDSSDDHPEILALWRDVHAKNANYLLSNIQKLAGFWVKVGQYLSTRADVLPREYCTKLAVLQDSMPSKPLPEVLATLQEELDEESLAKIESIDPRPLSTASLAQVHRATLKPGVVAKTKDLSNSLDNNDNDNNNNDTNNKDYRHEVVLKVQHRGVASLMIQDMENLRVILQLLAKSDPDLDFGPVIREYNQEVRKELDFRSEAQNMVEVSDLLHQHKVEAIVPKPIDGLVQQKVLVMDFCEGFAIKDTESMDQRNVDRELLLERICHAWALQMHVGGFFNADPHAGNLLVSTASSNEDSSVPVLLDFGLTKRLDPPIKLAFARLMHSSYEGDVDGLMKSFVEMGLKLNRHDPMEDMANMQRGFGDTVPQERAKEVQKQKYRDYKQRQQAQKDEAGLQEGEKLRSPVEAWPAELVFFGRVTNMLRGLCSQLNVQYPYLKTMASAAKKTLQDSVPKQEHATQLVHHHRSDNDETYESSKLQQRLLQALEDLDQNGDMVGLQLCVFQEDTQIANVAAGTLGVANPRPVTPSSLFNVFSVSKAVLTPILLRLIQDQTIESLDDPVGKYWPEFGASKPDITVRHLLTHQAGLAHAYPEDATLDTLLDWSGMVDFMARHAVPSHEAGEDTQYHALTYAWLIGGLIEAATKRPYEDLLQELLSSAGIENNESSDKPRLFLAGISENVDDERDLAVLSLDKRGMMKSGSSPQPPPPASQYNNAEHKESEENEKESQKKRQGKQSLAKYRGLQQLMNPSVFNMRKVREAKLPSANGHASAESLVRLFQAIIRPDNPILVPEILEQARRPHRAASSKSDNNNALLNDSQSLFGLGFQLHDFVINGQTVTSIGHGGVGGSLVLAVPEEQVVVAFTLNQLSGSSPARQRLLGIVFDELGWQAPPSLPVT